MSVKTSADYITLKLLACLGFLYLQTQLPPKSHYLSLFLFCFVLYCPDRGQGPVPPGCRVGARTGTPALQSCVDRGSLPPTGHLPGESRSPPCTPNAEPRDLLFKSEDYYWQASYLSNRRSTIKIITKLTVEPQGGEFR